MSQLNLDGPHYLQRDVICSQVLKTSPGVYALGRMKDDGNYLIQFVGRSDTDLNGRLLKLADDARYPEFKYQYAETPLEAFELECKVFHRSAPEDNRLHPHRPEGSDWKCPGCEFYD